MRRTNPVWSTCALFALFLAGGACGSATTDGNQGPGTKPNGSRCSSALECASGACRDDVCALPTGGSGGGSGGASSGSGGLGPRFATPGSTPSPLPPGCGPDTAGQCGGMCVGTSAPVTVVRPPAALCFSGLLDPTPDTPSALIEQVVEEIGGRRVVHLRVTFDPSFVDNTYGAGACCGWSDPDADPADPTMKAPGMKAGKGHTFDDLVGSDHLELLLTDGAGETVMDFKLDYVSEDPSSACGYGTLGVSGGEGKMILGDASAVLQVATSIDRNLNGCGHCLTEDSPETDDLYTPNPAAPDWDYRVVYEVWIDAAAFGSAGFGQAYIENVHASPSKIANNTLEVEPSPCPPGWDTPYCPPDVAAEGRNCGNECPPNYALYVATEGASSCVPIPFSNYPGMTPCPAGYELDPATEGRFCLPAK